MAFDNVCLKKNWFPQTISSYHFYSAEFYLQKLKMCTLSKYSFFFKFLQIYCRPTFLSHQTNNCSMIELMAICTKFEGPAEVFICALDLLFPLWNVGQHRQNLGASQAQHDTTEACWHVKGEQMNLKCGHSISLDKIMCRTQ